jgi:hypothetical protein
MLTRAIQELDIQITDLTALTGDTGLGLLDAIKNWLADTANGIQNIFAKRVTTDELCIEDVCVTRDQFLQLLENAGVDGTNGRYTTCARGTCKMRILERIQSQQTMKGM